MIDIEKYIEKTVDKNTKQEVKEFSENIVKNKQKSTFSFLFATDLHYKSDNILCFGTIKKLREMVMCADMVKPDLIVLNGDLTDGHSKKNIILSELFELLENLKNLNIPIIINKGNHDSATWFAYENKSSEYIRCGEWNEIISRVTNRDECGYGYLDFKKHKTRAIYLNTSDIENKTDEFGHITTADACEQWQLGISEKQVNWLKNVLLSCPFNYSVILFSHNIPCDALNPKSAVDNGEQVWEMIKDFSSKNKVIAYMYGHRHRDSDDVIDGINCICTKDMMNASVLSADNTVYCATLKDIPIICEEPVLHNPNAQILGGWDYVEISNGILKSKRFLSPEHDRSINI